MGPTGGAITAKSADERRILTTSTADTSRQHDDEFLQRDDRAMRQQNANATNRHDERATVRTADANDRFLTPAMIEACRLLSAEFLSRDYALTQYPTSGQKPAQDAEHYDDRIFIA